MDKEGALDRLDAEITALLEASRTAETASCAAAQTEVEAPATAADPETSPAAIDSANDDEEITSQTRPQTEAQQDGNAHADSATSEVKYASGPPSVRQQTPHDGYYRVNELQEWSARIDAGKFYGSEYDETLKAMISAIITSESPLLETVLVQRIARLHAFSRAGRLIRERVMELVDKHYHVATDHFGETFVWHSEAQRADWNTFRLPATDNDIRQIDAIPCEELRALAISLAGNNTINEMTRALGIKRLTGAARQKLESLV